MSSMLRRLIGEDVDFSTDFQKDIGFINTDIGQIHQIVITLAVNARYAIPHGGQLTIETANHGILNSDVHFLQKPFTADSLIRYVQETIHSKPNG